MKNSGALAFVALAGAALAAYSARSVYTSDGATEFEPDYSGAWTWPDSWGIDVGSPVPVDYAGEAPIVIDTNYVATDDDVTAAAYEYIAPPPPQMVHGFFADMGDKLMGTWKVREYPKYASAITEAERRYGLPRDLLGVTLYKESRYRPDVIAGVNRSPVGALGIAQFMPGTAAELGINPLDPFAAIDASAKYLKRQYDNFHDWRTALMAYNWGPGNVSKWLRKTVKPPLPAETSDYVAFITANVPALA